MIAHVEMLLANRQRHEDKAAVRYSTLEGVVAEFTRKMQALEDAQDRIARCTCDHAPGFEIDTRKHNGPLDAQFTLARFKRMAGEDAR
jgi:hypothetical protein